MAVWLAVVAVFVSASAQAQTRPRAVDLLPERTSVYVQIEDIRELMLDMQESNFGRMLADEQIAPLVNDLYAEARTAWEDIQLAVGDTGLDEIMSLPQGEICFAVITPRRKTPALALIMDVDKDSPVAQRLIDRGRELAVDDGGELDSGSAEGIEYHVVRGNDPDEMVYYVLHEGTFLACSNEKVFTEMMARWMGTAPDDDRTLAGNRKFVTIMNKCKSTEDLPMALSFFVDPIMLARSITAGDLGARVFLGALPVLGLDGLNGIGGAALFNEKDYESVFHAHVLLANPRAGIFEMIALKPGYYEPESFVPADVASYNTSHWDFRKLMAELEKIVDTFTSEGTFQEGIQENINEELDIDFQSDFIENLEGRVTFLQYVNESRLFNSQSNALAIGMENEEQAIELVEKILDRIAEEADEQPLITEEYKGVTIWRTEAGIEEMARDRQRERRAQREGKGGMEIDNQEQNEGGVTLEMRPTIPCFCFIDNNFIVTESPELLEHLIDTHKGDVDWLGDDPEYDETMDEMRTLLGTNLPSVVSFSKPAETLRLYYEMVDTENTRDLLARGAEDNKYVRGLQRVVEDNPLPPFDDIAHYFPPQGAFVVNDDTGFHFLAFQRRATDENE